MPYFNIVAQTNENTVVTEYEPVKVRSDSYQSEADLEKYFIRILCEQGYEYLPIHKEEELIANLRQKMELLNNYQFSDDEWSRFFSDQKDINSACAFLTATHLESSSRFFPHFHHIWS